jgi:hypothetical protein
LNDQPTLPDLRRAGPGRPPTWPLRHEGNQPQPRPSVRRSAGCLGAAALGAGVIVLLIGMLTLLSHADFFSLGRSASTSTPATPTPTAALSPTPASGWLQVAPTSVQLSCGKDQQAQVVVLANHGPQPVQWQANLSGSADPAEVEVAPNQGDLAAGASTSIHLQMRHHASSQQGVITFDPVGPDAGSAPSLSFSTAGCH